ncbi:DUF6783 domain-containing protein [uncultured Robinsoniella sp.]|uniref:DUF6783 domain-containing protein n=1 Tax=uncultured Robinsoniella sp. TaxID=904190 RepID=UPI00374E29B0
MLYSGVFAAGGTSHLHNPLSGIFALNLGYVAHCAHFIRVKTSTKCDAQIAGMNFKHALVLS